ncbi:pinin/SDK/memA/ protein conserved region domain-containing protein [Ditylenchus destructor]|uniref:Pinin/SDK/memA/ protein conserved region domain-containing protein n=1 Tax=Ditylenchus destructor TaxID=166010 RepID=A0AAD4R4C8_9BILA|nr:pinin/SDK/memA/ protein conserved region domain-containing protein [Ditylenchus destructor]
MAVDLATELDRAYEDLRGIDSELTKVSGRAGGQLNGNRRVSIGNGGQVGVSIGMDSYGDRNTRGRINVGSADNYSHRSSDRRVQEVGNRRRIVVSTDNGEEIDRKRSYNDYDNEPPLKRTLQSSVVMPTIETKSREATISEMKKNTTNGDTVRNRRIFSNLLVGTLKQFQKEETSANNRVQTQIEKQREVERRLETTQKEEKNRILKEKEDLLMRRREKEQEILRLKRKKAIAQYAEQKENHLRRLQCFIQTQTKPPLFFLPAKHTLRTLELLKESSKKVDALIELRRQEMDRELHRDSDIDSDSDDVKPSGLRSAVVPVSKSLSTDHESSANHANEETIDRPKKNDKNGERQNGDDDKEKSEEKSREEKPDEAENKMQEKDMETGQNDKNEGDEEEQEDVEIEMET